MHADVAANPEGGAEPSEPKGSADDPSSPENPSPAKSSPEKAADGEGGENKGADNAVSALQELIQSASSFSPHTKILTWGFEQQLEKGTLEFRATVSFVLADVPHHFCGGWQTSKKKAQRDAAERVTQYLQHSGRQRQAYQQGTPPSHTSMGEGSLPSEALQELKAVLNDTPFEGDPYCEWKIEDQAGSDGTEYRATVSFYINEVPHHFCGAWTSDSNPVAGLKAAKQDCVERVLWYFGEGEENFGLPEGSTLTLQPPPAQIVQPSDPAQAEKQAEKQGPQLEDKTILMQVQNTLQKRFAKDTPPGERVWVWSYEGDDTDPQLFRARVDIPSWGRTFFGGWCRGKKLAQRNACLVVKDKLDELGTAP